MGSFRVIDPQVKADAIDEVKNQGMPVSQAAIKYGVDPRTIYHWLQKEVIGGDKNLILELNRLKKENEQLYNLLGRATAELKRPKG